MCYPFRPSSQFSISLVYLYKHIECNLKWFDQLSIILPSFLLPIRFITLLLLSLFSPIFLFSPTSVSSFSVVLTPVYIMFFQLWKLIPLPPLIRNRYRLDWTINQPFSMVLDSVINYTSLPNTKESILFSAFFFILRNKDSS